LIEEHDESARWGAFVFTGDRPLPFKENFSEAGGEDFPRHMGKDPEEITLESMDRDVLLKKY
jgi:hypothetical protein